MDLLVILWEHVLCILERYALSQQIKAKSGLERKEKKAIRGESHQVSPSPPPPQPRSDHNHTDWFCMAEL